MYDACAKCSNKTACGEVANGLLTTGLHAGIQFIVSGVRDVLDAAQSSALTSLPVVVSPSHYSGRLRSLAIQVSFASLHSDHRLVERA